MHAYTRGLRHDDLSLKEMVDLLTVTELAYANDQLGRHRDRAKDARPPDDKKKMEESNPRRTGNWRSGRDNRNDKYGYNKRGDHKMRCHLCGEEGHIKYHCPKRQSSVAAVSECEEQPKESTEPEEEQREYCRVFAEELMDVESKSVDIKPLQLIVEAQENIKADALKKNVEEASNAIVKAFEKKKEMTIDVKVAGLSAKALVDTGATGSCMDATFARQAKLKMEGEEITAKLANSSAMRILGRAKADIDVLGKSTVATFMVCELKNPERPLILGRDVLRDVQVVITLGKDREEIMQRDGYGDMDNDTDDEGVCMEQVAATEQVIQEHLEQQRDKEERDTGYLPKEFEQFIDVFDQGPMELPPERPNYDMKIELEGPAPLPVRQYHLSKPQKEEMKRQVEELKTAGLIQESSSNILSPVLFVPKKSGEQRMCIDYRKLNAVTVTNPNVLPLIEDILNSLQDKKIFTTLDLRSGYHQLRLTPDSRKFTAFMTPEGAYEFLVTPFGLKNAPTAFQRFMSAVVKGIEAAHVYLDDIVIASSTREDHIKDVKQVLQRLREFKLCCNQKKVRLFSARRLIIWDIVSVATEFKFSRRKYQL